MGVARTSRDWHRLDATTQLVLEDCVPATSPGYSVTVRAQCPASTGATSELTTAVGTVGGSLTALDVVESHHDQLVVDVTCDADAIADAVSPEELNPSYIVPSVFDPTAAPAVAAAIRRRAGAHDGAAVGVLSTGAT